MASLSSKPGDKYREEGIEKAYLDINRCKNFEVARSKEDARWENCEET